MSKKSKAKLPKPKSSKSNSKRASIPSPPNLRNVNFERNGSVTYTAVPFTDTENEDPTAESSENEDPTAESSDGEATSPPRSKSKQSKRKGKKVKKSKRRARTDSDDDSVVLERKPSPVLAPLPSLTREEYEFFELVGDGDTEEVAAFLQSDSFKDMDINKLNKSGFTVLHIAVRKQDVDMVKLLLKQPGIRLYDTILYAVREKNMKIAKMLLEEYDKVATEEQRQAMINSAMIITKDPNQQQQLSKMVETSFATLVPEVSPISTRSGVKSSIKINNSTKRPYRPRSFYEPKINIPTTSVPPLEMPADDNDEIPFDSEFSPVITPLMLAAQQGSYSLIELFYSRNERLESEEFHHNIGCECDVCVKLGDEQDMTRITQRFHLYKALINPHYICFIGRNEHKDPINYALKKIAKIRELMSLDYAFSRGFRGFEQKLERFITKMLELCRSTTETEIFLSPKDEDERLPHLYPRLWYTMGQDLKKFVTSPNAQNIVYKLWATDDWPEFDSYTNSRYKLWPLIALRMTLWPLIGILLFVFGKKIPFKSFRAPVSRLITYIGSYLWFLWFVYIQAFYNYQRCNSNSEIPWLYPLQYFEYKHGLDDDHCTERGPPTIGTEPIILIFVLSFYVNILKRQSVSWYWRMRWNWIDFIDQLLFTATFGCWGYLYYWVENEKEKPIDKQELTGTPRIFWPPDCAEVVGECLLSLSFLLAFARLIRYLILVPKCGPIQMGFSHQVVDFVKSLVIMGVVMISFASGLMGLYMPYKKLAGTDPEDNITKPITDGSFVSIPNTFKTLFWILQGKKGISTTKMGTWLQEKTVPNSSKIVVEEISHKHNEYTGWYLYTFYYVIGGVMLRNILAGYFSQNLTQITANLDLYWKFARTELFLTFIKDTMAPPPFNLIPPLAEWTRIFKWLGCTKSKEKSACSVRQCCYMIASKKTRKWQALMQGYRELILQLIYRYMQSHKNEKEAATKDYVVEIGELLTEIKAIMKKSSEKAESSDDDDDNHQFPGGGSGAVGSTSSVKTGWTKPKTMLQSSGATFLKNKVRSGGPSGIGSNPGNSSGGQSTPPTKSQQVVISVSKPTPPKRDPSGGDNTVFNTPTKTIKTAGVNASTKDYLKPPKSEKKSPTKSKRPDSTIKQTSTSNKSNNPSYIPNEVEKGSRTGGTIERNPGLEDFSGACGIDSAFKSAVPSSSQLSNNNNPFNSTTTIVNNSASTSSPKNNQPYLNNKNSDPTKSYSQAKRGSKNLEKAQVLDNFSGTGPIQDAFAYKNTKDITGNPSKSSKVSTGPTSTQSQVTPKKPNDLFTETTTTPPSQVNKYNPEPVPSSRSKPTKPFLDKSMEIKPSTGTLNTNYQNTMSNACEYSQPRRGSRSGGGLERPPDMGDFSGPGEIDEPYRSPSKSANNFNSSAKMGAAPIQTPPQDFTIKREDFTTTPPSSKANNVNAGAKESSSKSIKTLKSTTIDKPCGGVPSVRTTVNSSDFAQPRRGSRSGGGLERPPDVGDFSGPGEIDEPYRSPSKSANNFNSSAKMGAAPIQTPPQDFTIKRQDFTTTPPSSKANNVNSKEPSSKSIKTLKSTTNDKPSGGVPSKEETANDYAQPRRGSRSGGGLERSPEMGDFSGAGEMDEPYRLPSKSTNNVCPFPEASPKKSPLRQDFTRTPPSSKAKNINSGAKEPSSKLIKTLTSTTIDKPCGGVPSGEGTAKDYIQPRRGSRSGGGLERPPDVSDFSGAGEIDEPYKSPSKTANNVSPTAEIGATPKKSTGIQNSTSTSPDNNQSGWKACSTCTVKPSAAKTECDTCSVKPSAGTILRSEKESLHKGEGFSDEIPRRGSGKLVNVWQSTSTVAGSTRDIPGYLGGSAGPMSPTKLKMEDSSSTPMEVRFRASKKPRNGEGQNSPSKSPSVIPSPAAKAPPIPAMPLTFSSDSTGDATDGSSKANDYKNPSAKSKSNQRPF